jgi:hypothetical protein
MYNETIQHPELIYNEFLNSDQAKFYKNIHYLPFEKFTRKDLRRIKEKCKDMKKCIFIGRDREPHWYDKGSSVSLQFQRFMDVCKQEKIFNTDFFVPCFGQMFKNDFDIMNKNYFGWAFLRYNTDTPPFLQDNSYNDLLPTYDFSTRDIQYKFLHMNRTHRMHRQLLSKFIIAEKLLEDNCVAINIDDNSRNTDSNDNADAVIPVMQNDEWDLDRNLRDLWRNTELYQHRHPVIDDDFNRTRYNFIGSSGIYIVSETVFNHPYPWFSEKTISALLSQRPFILVAPQGSLRTLKEKGYKTFDDIFDETYDTISDPSSRMEAVFHLIKDVNKKSLDEVKQHVLKCKDKLIHNRNLMINNIRKHINNEC